MSKMGQKKWKTVANEKFTAEIVELSSFENIFWTIHITKKARTSPKRKVFGLFSAPDKWIEYFHSFWRTKEEMAGKRPN